MFKLFTQGCCADASDQHEDVFTKGLNNIAIHRGLIDSVDNDVSSMRALEAKYGPVQAPSAGTETLQPPPPPPEDNVIRAKSKNLLDAKPMLSNSCEPPPAPIEYAELEWMNYVMQATWPKIRVVLSQRVVKEVTERVQIQIDRSPKIGQQLGLTDAEVSVIFDAGEVPPELRGLRTHHGIVDDIEALTMQAEVGWTSGEQFVCKPQIRFPTGYVSRFSMPDFALTGVELRGIGTMVLTPLTTKVPCFGAAQVYLFDPPECVMKVTGLKGSFGPLSRIIAAIMKKTMMNVIMDSFVLPNRMLVRIQHDLPLETLVKAKSPLPLGVFEIQIYEAEGLVASDVSLTGVTSSDPYVQVSIGDCTFRTSTVVKTCSPRWNDGPDWLPVFNLNQLVRIEVFDDDAFTEDDQIGWIRGLTVYLLCKEQESSPQGKWFDVTSVDPGESGGRLRLRARFLCLNGLGLDEDAFENLAQPFKRMENSDAGGAELAFASPDQAAGAPKLQIPINGTARPKEPKTNGVKAHGRDEKMHQPAHTHPYLITVKLLGLEGQHTRFFTDARCKVEWIPNYVNLTGVPDQSEAEQAVAEESDDKNFVVRAGHTILNSFAKTVETTVEKVHALQRYGFGEREPGYSNIQRSSKAVSWSSRLRDKLGSSALPPMVVRSIEQLSNREGWDLDRIAHMFGLDIEHVKTAAALRANFEVVWHQSLHFLQPPGLSPFDGAIRLTLSLPKHVLRMHHVPDLMGMGMMDDNFLVGTIVLKLKHQTIAADKPWIRRVREVFRREDLECENGQPGLRRQETEVLVGEGQTEAANLGGIVPGVLIEFMVELRSMRDAPKMDTLLSETEREDQRAAWERSSTRGVAIHSE